MSFLNKIQLSINEMQPYQMITVKKYVMLNKRLIITSQNLLSDGHHNVCVVDNDIRFERWVSIVIIP